MRSNPAANPVSLPLAPITRCTKERETADAYIERLANEIGRNESVRVVTSDSLIRLSALRSGVLRTSAKEFRAEIEQISARLEQAIADLNKT